MERFKIIDQFVETEKKRFERFGLWSIRQPFSTGALHRTASSAFHFLMSWIPRSCESVRCEIQSTSTASWTRLDPLSLLSPDQQRAALPHEHRVRFLSFGIAPAMAKRESPYLANIPPKSNLFASELVEPPTVSEWTPQLSEKRRAWLPSVQANLVSPKDPTKVARRQSCRILHP